MNKKRTLLKATILPLISLPLILTPVILTSCGNGQGGGQPTPYKKSFDASILGAQHGTFELEITGTAAKFISFSNDTVFPEGVTSFNFNDGYISDPETGKRFTIIELGSDSLISLANDALSKFISKNIDLVIPSSVQKIDSHFSDPISSAGIDWQFKWKSITLNEGLKTIEKNANLELYLDKLEDWKLSNLNLPSTLEFVGPRAFGNFHDIYINKKNGIISELSPTEYLPFNCSWFISEGYIENGTIHVPQSLLDVYQNNWNWKTRFWDTGVTLVGDIQ